MLLLVKEKTKEKIRNAENTKLYTLIQQFVISIKIGQCLFNFMSVKFLMSNSAKIS